MSIRQSLLMTLSIHITKKLLSVFHLCMIWISISKHFLSHFYDSWSFYYLNCYAIGVFIFLLHLKKKEKLYLSCIYSHQHRCFLFLEGKIELPEILLAIKLLKQGQAFQYGDKMLINGGHCPTHENLCTTSIWDRSFLG